MKKAAKTAPKTRQTVLSILLFLTIFGAAFYKVRAFVPYPNDYVTRLRWLNNWSSRGRYGFNCASLISNAHDEQYLNEREIYAGANGRLSLIAEVESISKIDESKLQPGDVAAFQGPTKAPFSGHGFHVAAYLGNGIWIDSDTRRGYVGEWVLADNTTNDTWFQGKVRLLRWNATPRARWQFVAATSVSWFMGNPPSDRS
jgi:hypothetical protein